MEVFHGRARESAMEKLQKDLRQDKSNVDAAIDTFAYRTRTNPQ